MKSFWNTLHKIGDVLHLPDLPNWLIGVLALVLILRIPTFFEPYNYGDEMIYLTLGQGVRQGIHLYSGIYDNKPPLLYLTAAAAGSLFWFKAALALSDIISIVILYRIAESLFAKNSKFQKIATITFALLTTLPLLEGGTANAEGFMMLPTLFAFYILLTKSKKVINLLLSGVLFGIATLYKVPAAFELPVIMVYWLITSEFEKGKIKTLIRDSFFVVVGFLIPIAISLAWFYFQGDLAAYIKAAFLQNIGYLSSYRPGDVQKPFLERNAPLLIRGLIVLAGLIVITLARKKISKNFIFMCCWVLFVLFAITLSERPYPHYFLQGVAPISLLLATLFTDKSIEQVFSIIPLTLAFFVPFYYKFWLYPITPYYLRFINFATGKITKMQYFSEFSMTTPRNYEIADFLTKSSTPNQRVFMWDPDSPTVYALARRLPGVKFVVPYHVNDYSSVNNIAAELTKNPPKFIIVTSAMSIPQISDLIKENYILVMQVGNAEIFSKVYNSGNAAKQ